MPELIEYKKFFGVEKSLYTLIHQAVEGQYLEPLKEEYSG